jgi:hypothetical protein
MIEKKLNKYLTENAIGRSGIERVRKFLHIQVDKYIKELEPMSDAADNDFFVRDFYKWFEDR